MVVKTRIVHLLKPKIKTMSKLMLFRMFIIMFLGVSFLVSHKMEDFGEVVIMLFTCMMTGAYIVAEVVTVVETAEDK